MVQLIVKSLGGSGFSEKFHEKKRKTNSERKKEKINYA